jgi:thiol-disulfide isomerase/thioredoxin
MRGQRGSLARFVRNLLCVGMLALWVGVAFAAESTTPAAPAEAGACTIETNMCAIVPTSSTEKLAQAFAAASEDRAVHREVTADKLFLTIFYTYDCPHCADAMAFLAALTEKYGECPECAEAARAIAEEKGGPRLIIRAYEIKRHPENLALFREFAESYGTRFQGVPTIFLGEKFYVGFKKGASCRLIAEEIRRLKGERAACATTTIDIPWFGAVNVAAVSLPQLTLALGFLDGFNPCAMWVLMFLLGLLVYSGSRRRILFIGMTFVLASGLVYFAFMAAWLNLFLVIGISGWLTKLLAAIAVGMGLVNLKDAFFFKQGVSLMIPESAKPSLYRRARAILHEQEAWLAIVGTVILAVLVNFIELACTVGLPALFTKILAERQVPAAEQYLYLALYNVVYVIPLVVIVALFAITLGHWKLQESHARALKLVSGLLMLALGLTLLLKPQLLILA